jgi:hypothetical protein
MQDDFGARIAHVRRPRAGLRGASARGRAGGAESRQLLLYGRADFPRGEAGELLVTELELVEPSLFSATPRGGAAGGRARSSGFDGAEHIVCGMASGNSDRPGGAARRRRREVQRASPASTASPPRRSRRSSAGGCSLGADHVVRRGGGRPMLATLPRDVSPPSWLTPVSCAGRCSAWSFCPAATPSRRRSNCAPQQAADDERVLTAALPNRLREISHYWKQAGGEPRSRLA